MRPSGPAPNVDTGPWRQTYGTPSLTHTQRLGPTTIVHMFKLSSPYDIYELLVDLVREAYEVGLQHHLRSREKAT